jgi:uncharacterized protein involved in outer membrane biogenesis
MSRKQKLLTIFACLVAFYTLAGFIVIPMILESILPKKLAEALHRPVSVAKIRLNPYALSLTVTGFDIKDTNGSDPFVSFERLFVNIDGASLFRLKPAVEELSLEKPRISLSRLTSRKYNFSDLLPAEKKEKKPETEKQPLPVLFAVSNVRIMDGNVTFKDIPMNKTHVLSPINFSLPFISNEQSYIDTFATPILEGSINETGVSIKVETKPFKDTIETIVHLDLTGIPVPYYFAYAPNDLGFKITDGSIDLQSELSYKRADKDAVFSVQGKATLAHLTILDRHDAPVLKVPNLKVAISPSHPLQRQLKIASVIIEQAELNVSRDTEGKLNLLSLGPPPAPSKENTPPAETAPAPDAAKEPFKLQVDEINLGGCRISYTDRAASQPLPKKEVPPVQMILDNIVLTLNGFSLAPESRVSFNLKSRLNNEASITADGQATLSPLSVDSKFDLGDLSLQWIAPYIPENIRLSIADGRFSTSGNAAVKTNPDGKLTATVKGAASIDKFNAKDKDTSESFVSWDLFSLGNVDFSYNPLRIDIETIKLQKFTNHLAIEKDGALNAVKIFKAPEAPPDSKKETPKEKESASRQDKVPVKIGKIELKDFGVAFADKKIEPNFSTRLNLSEANISGLTTEGFKAARVFAKGKIDDYAPIEIKGDINPLGDDLFLDMTLGLSNLELSPFSPYTGKYIGRAIEKGKLNVDISDRIETKNINGRLKLMLDQFTLGQKIDSPDALNLPVGLAVSLLKDRSGKIAVDVPVSGRTDDPQYKPGGLILQAIENIITKAATSPFDLVASVVAGGEELKFIDFEPGTDQPDEKNLKKIGAVATLMFERPGLMIDLSGFADADKDRQAIARMILDKKIKELKYADLSKKEKAATTVQDVSLTDDEYQDYLEEIYKADVLSNPEKGAGAKKPGDKTLTLDEIKTLIIGQMNIDDNQLRDLAARRTQQVKNEILKDGRVEASRLFLKETGTLASGADGNQSAGRVELSLK